MESYIKDKLNLKFLNSVQTLSGCVNMGNVYETDRGKIFVKHSSRKGGFYGEFESLKELRKTKIIKVPEPLFRGEAGKKQFLVMEYVNLKSLSKYSADLGRSLGELHLFNIKALKNSNMSNTYVGSNNVVHDKFGFHIDTECGYIPQCNEWSDDWLTFYARQKLQPQINLIIKDKGNREIMELWSSLNLKIPFFFKDIAVEPSLLHGDLWAGNVGETDTEPVIYDPASFYGHHEYDLAIAVMFGGFSKSFFDSYHRVIPKCNGFQKRQKLYLLFHHLNHWNHFNSHKTSSLNIMKDLIKCAND